jgi:hypothetical protein
VLVIHAAQLEEFIDDSEKAPSKTLEVEEEFKKFMIPNPDYVI